MNPKPDGNILRRLKIRPILTGMAVLVIPVMLYSIILSIPIYSETTNYARNGGPLVFLLILIAIYPAFNRRGWLGEFWTYSIAATLFGMVLSWNLTTGVYDGDLIGGLLPWSDANDYFSDASRILVGERFSLMASRRPFYPGLFSLVLGLTNSNLKLSLAILGLIAAFSSALFARIVRQSEGALIGSTVFMILYLYFRSQIGRVMTENLGFTLGVLGFSLLWYAGYKKKVFLYLFGIFTLTFALVARAGAYFVLPMLILWGLRYFWKSRRSSILYLILSIAAVIIPFAINQVVIKVAGAVKGEAFANFGYTLYGLASGYRGWYSAITDLPGVSEGAVYPYVIDKIKSNPSDLALGIFRAYQDLFSLDGNNAFQFMQFQGANRSIATISFFLLCALGLIWCLSNIKSRQGSFILFSTLGFLLSIPFAPTIDSSYGRIYAATIPLIALLIGFGLAVPIKGLGWLVDRPTETEDQSIQKTILLAIVLMTLSVLAPIGFKWFGRVPALPESIRCATGEEMLTVFYHPDSSINLVKNSVLSRPLSPDLRIRDFRSSVQTNIEVWPGLSSELREIPPGKTLFKSLDFGKYHAGQGIGHAYVIVDTVQLPSTPGLLNFCAIKTENKFTRNYSFYNVQEDLSAENQEYIPISFSETRLQWAHFFLIGVIILSIFEPILSIIVDHRSKRKGI